ncbi:MAG: DUF5686 family protein [Crocinitomicaceae bacterium]|nr:DUF5686 family protein [Crocinitomicaceae bacterium]MDG1776648.1 DUF5686 family protein [Crocinitomicaceae bacterium]
MRKLLIFIFLSISITSFSQKTIVEGVVRDQISGDPMPFVTVRFQNSKIGIITDTLGAYRLNTYYATDSIVFSFSSYVTVKHHVKLDEAQTINVEMPVLVANFGEVVVKAPDELPSTRLHRKLIANKHINNKQKLASYEYEVYNKVQLDINNIDEQFKAHGIVKKLDVITDYLDSTNQDKDFLPIILSESVSDYYYKKNPKRKKEVVKATRVSGVESIELNQFLGDMYLDVNIYDNNIKLFNKSFISPASDYARNFYRFYLEDSLFINQYWCYKLSFKPKRKGETTFEGELWIHDTTYAVKSFHVNISPWVNINYVQDLAIDQEFTQVEPEVWMLTNETMFADLKITRNTKVYGMFGRKQSSRRNYVINTEKPADFYKSNSTVEIAANATKRDDLYWKKIRHEPLAPQEQGIDEMLDSLENLTFFNTMKNTIYFLTTGYYPVNKLEIGNAFSLININPIENVRLSLALRTSNAFSKRVEFGGNLAYGLRDDAFKYGASMRFKLSPKKRGVLSLYYSYNLEQIGQSSTAVSSFGNLLQTGPLDRLTFVEKVGVNLEKDILKDIIIFAGFEWKEYTATGTINYLKPNKTSGYNDTINKIHTTEFVAKYRWAKNEEFISGSFDRTSIRSKYPIIELKGTFGVKGLFGGDYNYQKIDLSVEHTATIGVLGRIRYGINAGTIFGSAAYPFLTVHEGNQSYWLSDNAFNKMNFFEFISDRYASVLIENHWEGFFFDKIPWVRKAKLRLVTTGKAVFGQLSQRHLNEMILPTFTKQFENTPYVEVAMGIENIFKLGRVDVFWRLTHLNPGVNITDIQAFGIRTKYVINF